MFQLYRNRCDVMTWSLRRLISPSVRLFVQKLSLANIIESGALFPLYARKGWPACGFAGQTASYPESTYMTSSLLSRCSHVVVSFRQTCFIKRHDLARLGINLIWPRDAIWRHRSGSILALAMASCLTVPSDYIRIRIRNLYCSNITRIFIHAPMLADWQNRKNCGETRWFKTNQAKYLNDKNMKFAECKPVFVLERNGHFWHVKWWRHQMETSSALLVFCAGNSPVPDEFPSQRPVTRSFGVSFDLCLNKQLSKQSWGWWFQKPWLPYWRHCNDSVVYVGDGSLVLLLSTNFEIIPQPH